ncbi:hypothetical protein NDN01_10145 [Sphingomonas sp. QA11]|uniref:hypothetical protein n=1 Tax=Sphingomonas sp. QA11 TaxID=2950605 RepID=UPI00234AB9A0|nr:hypothetical protein [Sphingomonas sp. QA11]WCM29214.1 hypothetical protein NDN01_10145 [Sphingomonas sp. QA11]
MSADDNIAEIRADLLQIRDAFAWRSAPFDIGLLDHDLLAALRSLSRATDERPDRIGQVNYATRDALIVALRGIQTRLEDCIQSGSISERSIVGETGPALYNVSRAIVGLIKITGREAARPGSGA